MSTHITKRLLILDFDGTLRYPKSGKGFIDGPEDVAIFSEVPAKIKKYKNAGYFIAGLTNQSGVAFGFKTPEDVRRETLRTCELLQTIDPEGPEGPELFDVVLGCFAHEDGKVPEHSYRSLLRKPEIGMLALIERVLVSERNLIPDYDNSLFVGDREEDRLCAERAGIPFQWADDFRAPSVSDRDPAT